MSMHGNKKGLSEHDLRIENTKLLAVSYDGFEDFDNWRQQNSKVLVNTHY